MVAATVVERDVKDIAKETLKIRSLSNADIDLINELLEVMHRKLEALNLWLIRYSVKGGSKNNILTKLRDLIKDLDLIIKKWPSATIKYHTEIFKEFIDSIKKSIEGGKDFSDYLKRFSDKCKNFEQAIVVFRNMIKTVRQQVSTS